MPTGKRASMREGPLAALFRKTTEDAPGPEKPEKPAKRGKEVPPPETPAARAQEAAPEQEAPQIPTPQERLRQAFSSDIPASLLDPPSRQKQSAPAIDPFARPQRPPEPTVGMPAFGRPVIRVVGVGGAGVNAVNRMVEAEV